MKINLRFPELRGGTVQGLNDAGVENFLGAIDVYISRECGQNTVDAIRNGVKTARLEFDRLTIRANEIPAFGELRQTLKSCLDRWGSKEKEREFFEQAVELASKDEISVLKISDSGTTGLTGDDTNEGGRWFALVKSQGVSNKGDTAGGSFGIGKSSPFAASRFRTVFYSTRTEAGSVALQGVSRLVTHKNAAGKLTQGVGFIGGYDEGGGEGGEPIFLAARHESEIPSSFRRSEAGTDIWVLGYRSGPEWSGDLIRSILTNFWPAIHRGSIEFRVGRQIISQKNLPELINEYVGHADFEAHHFYKAILSQPVSKKLKYVGACELYLTTAAPDLPRRICMVRSTGMRIYDYQPKACRVPFSGLFICTDIEGNKLLRKMEPPRHDVWDPKRIEGDSGKKALDEIKLWIREEVKKLNPLFSGSSFNESELAKYVPDTDPDTLPQEESGTSDEESLEPRPSNTEIKLNSVQAELVAPVKDADDNGVEDGDGLGADQGDGDDDGNGGGDGGGGGGGQDEKGGGDGGGADKNLRPPTISVRSYNSGPSEYQLVLRSPADFKGALRVYAIGEDGRQELVELQGASLAGPSGRDLPAHGNLIQGVRIKAAEPLRIVVNLNALERRALTAVLQP